MAGRCYGCAARFTLFRKECGCPGCGRAFCAGCLRSSAAAARCGDAPQKLCQRCRGTVSCLFHPFHRRVAAFEAAVKPCQAGSGYQGLSKEDRAIAERLERLREERKPKSIPSEAEIEARLAALKEGCQRPAPSIQEMEDRLAVLQGRVPPSQAPRAVHQPPDSRSLTQQTDDLLTQLTEEVAIDERYTPEVPPQAANRQTLNDLSRESEGGLCPARLDPKQLEEEKNKLLAEAASELREENTRQEKILQVAKRLAALRGQDPEKVTLENYNLPDSDEEVDEEKAIQRVLKQLAEEAALDEASGFNIPPDQKTHQASVAVALPTSDESDEELPWCCICNEDATLRCHGCDGDLYCQRCFREGHDEFDLKDHHTSRYHLPRKQK
uniref:Zinc finger FYVE-type containing 19 n=1 Tax=Nothoprocta perdicaria TaxID=30464 RepID=A0A8C6Z196_NOTPE